MRGWLRKQMHIGGTIVTRGHIVSYSRTLVGGITAIVPMRSPTILIGTVLDQLATDRFRTITSIRGQSCIAQLFIAQFLIDRLY